MIRVCPNCQREYNAKWSGTIYCSKRCQVDYFKKFKLFKNNFFPLYGERNGSWNGGKTIDRHGYTKILKPNHPMADSKGYVYEHRFVMAEYLDKILTKDEVVHHVNGNRKDNRLENLQLMSHKEHKGIKHFS